jgi:hypothetical protein
MNRDVINAVADAIARSELATERSIGFNMATFWAEDGNFDDMTGHSCGTVACIAGWTTQMFDENGVRLVRPEAKWSWRNGSAFQVAASAMGIGCVAANELFTPSRVALDDVTQCQAVAVLRNLAENGVVDWSMAVPVDDVGDGYEPVRWDATPEEDQ